MFNSKQFINDALRTEAQFPEGLQLDEQQARQLHAAIGISTEAGELLDAFKKAIFYRKTLDVTNVKEETGDILWYLALLFDSMGTSFEAEAARVIAKLKERFPEKFTTADSDGRDVEAERKVLENPEAKA